MDLKYVLFWAFLLVISNRVSLAWDELEEISYEGEVVAVPSPINKKPTPFLPPSPPVKATPPPSPPLKSPPPPPSLPLKKLPPPPSSSQRKAPPPPLPSPPLKKPQPRPSPPWKAPPPPPSMPVKPPTRPPPVKPPRNRQECTPLCQVRCKLHSRINYCLRACITCCERCKCVPPGQHGNREKCGKCYSHMTTRGGRLKCP